MSPAGRQHVCLANQCAAQRAASGATRLQVLGEGRAAQQAAAELLGYFRQDYPGVTQAVKTRDTARTVLMHKSRFVASLLKAGLLEAKEANQLEARRRPELRL